MSLLFFQADQELQSFYWVSGIGGLAFIAVGYLALRFGVQLFREGVGLKKTEGSTELPGGIKITVSSVGGLLLMTSVVWGYFAYQMMPTQYENENGNRKVSDNRTFPSLPSVQDTSQLKWHQFNTSPLVHTAAHGEVVLKTQSDTIKYLMRVIQSIRMAPSQRMMTPWDAYPPFANLPDGQKASGNNQ